MDKTTPAAAPAAKESAPMREYFASPTGAPAGSVAYYEQAIEAGYFGCEDGDYPKAFRAR